MHNKVIFQVKSLALLLIIMAVIASPVYAHPDGPETQLVMTTYGGFCDYFSENALYKGWIWTDPLGDSSYSLNTNTGNLRLSTPDGEHDLFLNLNAPRMLQAFTGDFVIRTKVTINPQFDYQGAGLVVWQDANNYIRLEIGGTDKVINYIQRINGNYFDLNPDPASGLSTAYLQISRTGNTFSASYSVNGTTWFPVYTANYTASNVLYAGVTLINNWQDNPIYADFDFFEVGGCSASKTITQRVLHVIYNPYLPIRQRYLLSYYNDPRVISQQAMTSFRDYTQGSVNYVIKEELEVNAFPLRSDGFRHTEETFFYCIDNGWPNISMCDENITVNYEDVIAVNGICEKLNSGAIDEVWIDPPPRTGFFESALAGPRGFWYNGLTYSNNSCQDTVVCQELCKS